MTTRRRFDRDFKLEVLQQIERKPLAEICREHSLHPTMISRWRKEMMQYPKEAFKGKGSAYKLEARLAEAQRLIGQLYAENAFLKKVLQGLQERQVEERVLRGIR